MGFVADACRLPTGGGAVCGAGELMAGLAMGSPMPSGRMGTVWTFLGSVEAPTGADVPTEGPGPGEGVKGAGSATRGPLGPVEPTESESGSGSS